MAARVGTGILGAVVGLFVGTIATLLHQSAVTIASARVPWGVAVGLAAVVLVLLGLRWVGESRLLVGCGAAGVIVPIALFAMPGLGGSVIVPMNAVGLVWSFVTPLAALFIALWPRTRIRRGESSGAYAHAHPRV